MWLKNNKYLFGLALLFFFVVFIHGTKQSRRINEEFKWYKNELNYEFSGTVLSVRDLGYAGYGFLKLTLNDSSIISTKQEDSLQKFLKYNSELRFVREYDYENTITLVVFPIEPYRVGDSLYVNTKKSGIDLYRNSQFIRSYHIDIPKFHSQ